MKGKRFRKTRLVLQALCLMVGLTVVGWGDGPAEMAAEAAMVAPSTTIEVSGIISPMTNLSDIAVIYSFNNSSGPYAIFPDTSAENVAAEATGTFSFTVDDPEPDGHDSESYTIMGIYDANGDGIGDGVCVGGPGISADISWNIFNYNLDDGTAVTEEMVYNWLKNDDWHLLETFYRANFTTIAQDIGSDIPLWNFSDATANGTAHADSRVVPLPGALWLLGSGLLGLLGWRRKKRI